MRTLKLTLTYDGTDYVGWQHQANGLSVQEVMERAWKQITSEQIRITAASRTDAGVHALGQVASLTTESKLSGEVLRRALNAMLPDDVVVLDVSETFEGFNAITHSRGKRYRYVIQDGPLLDPISRRYAWFIPHRLDDAAMREAMACLVGTHDFASFESTGSERVSTIRTMFDVSLERSQGAVQETLVFEIAGDGFLYNMVRAIVGTIVRIGRGAYPPSWMREVLEARDRRRAGPTAPPQGLFLVKVDYE
jgi:tRNA pseudouridine38-40 synthase